MFCCNRPAVYLYTEEQKYYNNKKRIEEIIVYDYYYCSVCHSLNSGLVFQNNKNFYFELLVNQNRKQAACY
jgi:hypothetical protein